MSRSIGVFHSGHSTPTTRTLICNHLLGTWQARFKGKVFETIKLEKQQGKLTGSVRGADIEVDKDGELTSAQAIDSSLILTLSWKPALASRDTADHCHKEEKDSEDTNQFEMKTTRPDPGRASGYSRPRRPHS